MALAAIEAQCPDKLRADFQQYYGLDLDGMGAAYSYPHAAALATQLPAESRVMRELDAELEWTQQDYFLAQIEYDLRILIWQNSKDGQRNRNKPKPPKLPAEIRAESRRGENFDRDLIDKMLGGEQWQQKSEAPT